METRIVIKGDKVSREIEVTPGTVNSDERDSTSFLMELGKRVPFETGLMPVTDGILSIRQAGDHLQIVTQSRPGVNMINWGNYEGDRTAETYLLAQPYRIVVGDFKDGNLLGCRMFYSPVPIADLDQPLYHQNVPNLNCKGYRGNGVGWVCLYHRESWEHMDIAAKAVRMLERCSGVETYNDANMSSTDGPRFYQQMDRPKYTWDAKTWEEKSKKEGFEWTLDAGLWVPVLVQGIDSQDKHSPNGVALTLRMAMYGDAAAYYGDKYWPKPINGLTREDKTVSTEDLHQKIWTQTFVKTAKEAPKGDMKIKATDKAKAAANPQIGPPPKEAPAPVAAKVKAPAADPWAGFKAPEEKKLKCEYCAEEYVLGHNWTVIDEFGRVCENCKTNNFPHCTTCDKLIHKDYFDADKKICKSCDFAKACTNCGKETGKKIEGGCTECQVVVACVSCNYEAGASALQMVHVPATDTDVFFCTEDFMKARLCDGCGNLTHADWVVTTNELETLCENCAHPCQDCGRFYNNAQKNSTSCPSCAQVAAKV